MCADPEEGGGRYAGRPPATRAAAGTASQPTVDAAARDVNQPCRPCRDSRSRSRRYGLTSAPAAHIAAWLASGRWDVVTRLFVIITVSPVEAAWPTHALTCITVSVKTGEMP